VADQQQTLEQRATWHIGLWLANDQDVYTVTRSILAELVDSHPALYPHEIAEDARDRFAEELERSISGGRALDGLARDLVATCVAYADWQGILEPFLPDGTTWQDVRTAAEAES
jgi:hypothetical protein